MSKNEELDRLWNLIIQCSNELKIEAKHCKAGGANCTDGVTTHYRKLQADMRKLKAEYEKVKGGGAYDPTDQSHIELASKKKFLGDHYGKTGPETHTRLEG